MQRMHIVSHRLPHVVAPAAPLQFMANFAIAHTCHMHPFCPLPANAHFLHVFKLTLLAVAVVECLPFDLIASSTPVCCNDVFRYSQGDF